MSFRIGSEKLNGLPNVDQKDSQKAKKISITYVSPGNTNLRFIREGEEASDPLDPNSHAFEDPKTALRRMTIKKMTRTREGQRHKWLNEEKKPFGVEPRKLRRWLLSNPKSFSARRQGRPPPLLAGHSQRNY